MNITLEELSKLSAEEIYQKNKQFFDNVYYTNNFNNVTLSNYLSIVFDEIENSKIEYNGNTRYDLYIQKRVLQRIKSEDSYIKTDIISEYFKDIGNLRSYNKDEELDLIYKAQKGDNESRNRIIEGNLKLVISIAKRYINKGTPFEDLIQEGNFGLIKAIEKYDESKGAKFSTYASWWIHQMIGRSIANKSKTIRLPVYLHDRINKYKKTYWILCKKLNREPTNEEIAKELEIPIEMVEEITVYLVPLSSLNDYVSEDEDTELQDMIKDPKIEVEKSVIEDVLKDEILNLFDSGLLTQRQINVLKLRYGFDGNTPMTLEEIGKMYNISRERVRQIESNAFKRLITTKKIFKFVDYMDSPKDAFENLMKKYKEYSILKGNEHLAKEEFTLNEDGTIQSRKLKTIYDSFPLSTTFKVNTAFSKLRLIDQFFLLYRFGGSLSKPVFHDLTENQMKYYDEVLFPKILYLVRNLVNDSDIVIPRDTVLESNTFTKSDFNILKICFAKYKKMKKDYEYSLNHYFIDNLSSGFVNRKAYSKNDIMKILRLTEEEYENCLNEDKKIPESYNTVKRIVKKR